MKELKKEEMKQVEAGADPYLITSIIVSIITFIIGTLSGYSNPKKCN